MPDPRTPGTSPLVIDLTSLRQDGAARVRWEDLRLVREVTHLPPSAPQSQGQASGRLPRPRG